MGRHQKAWEGISLLVYGNDPMEPMKIEQALAEATPANEWKLESYEDYDDALNFCKKTMNVGFIFLLENKLEINPADIFRELSKPYQKKGWPTMGVLIHSGKETFQGIRTWSENEHILKYVSKDKFSNPTETSSTLDSIWESYCSVFNKTYMPEKLSESILSGFHNDKDSYVFELRCLNLLSQNINISWLDLTAIKWRLLIDPVYGKKEKFLEPHQFIEEVASTCTTSNAKFSFESIKEKNIPIVEKLYMTVKEISDAYRNNQLESKIDEISSKARPGSPALFRHIKNSKNILMEISKGLNSDNVTQESFNKRKSA